MTKDTHPKVRLITTISLFIFLCGAWAFAPLWVNPCIPTRLSEEEIKQFREQYGSKYISLEEQAKNDQRYRELEIPCGAQNLTTIEKMRARKFQGLILDEIEFMNLFILRFELVKTDQNGHTYYYKAYTFFYIPLYRAFGGGSGYLEIEMWPIEDHPLSIAEWE